MVGRTPEKTRGSSKRCGGTDSVESNSLHKGKKEQAQMGGKGGHSGEKAQQRARIFAPKRKVKSMWGSFVRDDVRRKKGL